VAKKNPNFYPVILAGGRGTRFWPLSRKKRAKQLLALDGKRTMIQQTMDRLLPLGSPKQCWVIANEDLRREIARQLPQLKAAQILAEPVGRNTAPAIGLAAFILQQINPKAIIGMFPSDHVIGDQARFRDVINRGIEVASAGENIVVMGIRPSRAETGYGYIEAGAAAEESILQVRRFTEKPETMTAVEFVRAGNYYWNSGMFLWSAQTLVNALTEYLPKTAVLLGQIATAFGTKKFASVFRKLYPLCENISIDYAVLEPRSRKGERASNLYCIPADFGWNDLGSWTALREHHSKRWDASGNLISAREVFTLTAQGNYIHAPQKFVAAVGVNNLVVVETEDALLITTLEHTQQVGAIVKYLDSKKMYRLV
jgi:mannose-1-phosphate guanylyltransferase